MKLELYETECEYINTFKEIKEGLDSIVKEEEITKLDQGNIKKERECPGIKNMIIEIRNSMNELNGTLDSDDERTDELEEE